MFKKTWGSEIIWGLTDKYIAKTVELNPNSQTALYFHREKEKSIMVIRGILYLYFGSASAANVKVFKVREGWTWNINPGDIYRYKATRGIVRLIEVSTMHMDDEVILEDEYGKEVLSDEVKKKFEEYKYNKIKQDK